MRCCLGCFWKDGSLSEDALLSDTPERKPCSLCGAPTYWKLKLNENKPMIFKTAKEAYKYLIETGQEVEDKDGDRFRFNDEGFVEIKYSDEDDWAGCSTGLDRNYAPFKTIEPPKRPFEEMWSEIKNYSNAGGEISASTVA